MALLAIYTFLHLSSFYNSFYSLYTSYHHMIYECVWRLSQLAGDLFRIKLAGEWNMDDAWNECVRNVLKLPFINLCFFFCTACLVFIQRSFKLNNKPSKYFCYVVITLFNMRHYFYYFPWPIRLFWWNYCHLYGVQWIVEEWIMMARKKSNS